MTHSRFSHVAPATLLLTLLLYLPPTFGAVNVPWGEPGLWDPPLIAQIPNDLFQDSRADPPPESVIIEFNVDNCALLTAYKSDTTTGRGAKISKLVDLLQQHSLDAQKEVIAILDKKPQKYIVLWIETEIYVELLDPAVRKLISDQFLGNKVKRIRPATTFSVADLSAGTPYTYVPSDGTPKHMQQINRDCPETSCLGADVRVAILDAGVDGNHPELKPNYLDEKEYSWFDYAGKSPTPVDTHGRGTRVAGVAVGKNIGVASKAKWMACRASLETGWNEVSLKLCGQWALCPTKYDGNGKEIVSTRKCDRAPHIIIFGWGFSNYGQVDVPRSLLYKTVQAWNAVNIFSSFAAGDFGSSCTSAAVPGNLPVSFDVGAVDGTTKTVLLNSARGPIYGFTDEDEIGTCPSADEICEKHCDEDGQVCFVIKPDLVAPGKDILAPAIPKPEDQSPANFNRYELASGTGVSAGIVGGVAAIMVCAGKSRDNMDQPALVRKLRDSAFKEKDGLNLDGSKGADASTKNEVIIWDDLCNKLFGGICGKLPNNLYGSGQVNACAATKAMVRRVE